MDPNLLFYGAVSLTTATTLIIWVPGRGFRDPEEAGEGLFWQFLIMVVLAGAIWPSVRTAELNLLASIVRAIVWILQGIAFVLQFIAELLTSAI